MENQENNELKSIRQAKLRELMKRSEICEKETTIVNELVEVTDASFKKFVQNHPLVVIDCWAPWCGPCRMVAPVIEELSQDYAGKIFFGKLNVDKNPVVSKQYGIMSIPTILILKNSKLVDSIVGAMPRQMLEPKITRYL